MRSEARRVTGLRYIDVCSGISAPTLAWKPLGWEALCFAEIEPAPRAVLKHHYPQVPLRGDFTEIEGGEYGAVDLIVGGTPCQDFSVAGQRAGLDGDRGNLTLEFSRLAYRSRSRWMVWENVPGVFSSNGGRDFGAVLATFSGRPGLVFEPPEGGWRNSGIVEPASAASFGLAWRVLDAQYFGVPQRRRRVFVVGYLGDWRRAAAVLFERHSLCGHPPPRREKGPGVARSLTSSTGGASAKEQQYTFVRGDGEPLNALNGEGFVPEIVGQAMSSKWSKGSSGPSGDEHHNLIAHTLRGEGFDASEDGTGRGTPLVPVDEPQDFIPDVADPLTAREQSTYTHEGKTGMRTRNVVAIQSVGEGEKAQNGLGVSDEDAMYSLTSRDQHAIAYGIRSDATREGEAKTPSADAEGKVRLRPPGMGVHEEIAPTLDASAPHAVCFQPRIGRNGRGYEEDLSPALNGADAGATSDMRPCVAFTAKDYGQDAGEEVAPTLRSGSHDASHANGGVGPAVAFTQNQRQEVRTSDVSGALNARPSEKRGSGTILQATAVRRLTPRECERLQGFPDDFTLVPYRGGTMADGPRYKMLGNSWAAVVGAWLGTRIQAVEDLFLELGRAAA
jgi:DNA (cytosine-5)-methyltransferase 1